MFDTMALSPVVSFELSAQLPCEAVRAACQALVCAIVQDVTELRHERLCTFPVAMRDGGAPVLDGEI
jgi:hypothetical protein